MRTEREVYEYFMRFGDILNIKYQDGSDLKDGGRQDVRIDFLAGHSLLLAVNSYHNQGLIVSVSQDCKVGVFNDGQRKVDTAAVSGHSMRPSK